MKKNAPLIIAGILIILILAVVLFPNLFTNKSPYTLNKMIFTYEDGKTIVHPAPFSPSKDFLFGTDDMGRDVYSYIIFGTRLTILLGVAVALGRFIIAIPIAISAGFGNRVSKTIIKVFNVIFSAIPAILISMIILKMKFFVRLDKTNSILSFIIVLSLVGWPKISRLIMERVETLNSQLFIKSEVAIGKKRFRIAIENVIPHLAPELIVLQLMEVARALTIIMTLGVFNVFVGNLKYIEDPASGMLNLFNIGFDPNWGMMAFYKVSFEPEWASMLATSRGMVASAPWAMLFPALAFFISILAFNLLGEGLRNMMQRKDSSVIPVVRKLFSLRFSYLWNHAKSSSKLKLIISFTLVMAIILVPYAIHASEYRIPDSNENEAYFEQVLIGTEEADTTAKIISDKMNSLGIAPLNNDSYYLDYDIDPAVILAEHTVMFSNDNTSVSGQINKDYAFLKASSSEDSGLIYDTTKEDLFNIKDYKRFENKFVLISKEFYEDSAVEYFIADIKAHAKIKGVLLVAKDGEEINNIFLKEDIMCELLISKDFAEKITDAGEMSLKVYTKVAPIMQKGRNIIGILGEYDPENENEAIMIGLNYNYLSEEGADVLKFNLDLVERLCETYDNRRSIIFVFADGTMKEEFNGLYGLSQNLPYNAYKIELFIDLTQLNKSDFDNIKFSNALAPFTRPFSWSIGTQLEKNFTRKNISIETLQKIPLESEFYLTESNVLNLMFWDSGIATVVVESGESGEEKLSVYDIGEVILKVISENGY